MYYTTDDLELLNVASQCLYYFAAYATPIYDDMAADSRTNCNAELLEKIYDILVGQGSEYDELVAYFDDEAQGNFYSLGAESFDSITKAECAGMLYLNLINVRKYLPKGYTRQQHNSVLEEFLA